jgi:hypothetical protein
MTLTDVIEEIASVDLFARDAKSGTLKTGQFVGRPFYLDYTSLHLLVADAWKHQAQGIPQSAFLLAYYENEKGICEALLLRVLEPCSLPTDIDVISSMIEYYKDGLQTSGSGSQLDSFTRYEFSFSGLRCRVLGTFYKDQGGQLRFGADVENFYSAHHYQVVKPAPEVLELIVNYREGGIIGRPTDIRIGQVRYSSTRRFQEQEAEVPVFVSPQDFLGKRTALFGMTRTGKSNTVKKIIQATVKVSRKAPYELKQRSQDDPAANLEPFTPAEVPKYPVGQIIFDSNGEYANANLQDEGTAIFELYQEQVSRYSTLPKPGFKVMKVNFYRDVLSGFELVRSHLSQSAGNYVQSFRAIDLTKPRDYESNYSARVRHDRKIAAYLCCLHRAGFPAPPDFKVQFVGNTTLNQLARGGLDPKQGLSLQEASRWFTTVWSKYADDEFFADYKRRKGHEWADEDLKAILVFLTRRKRPGRGINIDGYVKLRGLVNLHTPTVSQPFDREITDELRNGRIVIIDLSQGSPDIQRLYSERICEYIFDDAMARFIRNVPNNFVQFYFEEAHNLFPRKESLDLSQIYNRLAKEGAKLNLGLLYLTQEVSSISTNILKNTQNWFITHLNNEDETREIEKYYDFGDFADSLVRFSSSVDRGFVRMKTYSNPFVVPVQIDRFLVDSQTGGDPSHDSQEYSEAVNQASGVAVQEDESDVDEADEASILRRRVRSGNQEREQQVRVG